MLVNGDHRVLVQGITGREATEMVGESIAYGTRIVAGVTPGKGGQEVHGVPVFDTVAEAVEKKNPNVTIISVPAPVVLDAATEAIQFAIPLCIIMTERVPRKDTSCLLAFAQESGSRVIGPNTLGVIRPEVAKLGTIGGRVDSVRRSYRPGKVAILSRSGGMTTEIASFLTAHGIGQSIAVGVGGDSVVGSTFADLIELLEGDRATEAVVIFGEPGGRAEEQLAERLAGKPSRLKINAFLSGGFVDEMEGVRFGHAGVIVEGGRGSIRHKAKTLREVGVFVADRFDDILEGLPA
jgi:succinyl-CoA synthetase alpha subunit